MPDIQPEIDALWDWGNPAESERRIRRAAGEAAKAGEQSRELQLQTQVIRAMVLQRRFEDAKPLWRTLNEQMRTVMDPPFRARFYLESGRWDNDWNKLENAISYTRVAVTIAQRHQLDFLQVDALHMLAIMAQGEEAMRWHKEAIDVASASRDPRTRRWLATLHNNLGWTLFELGRHEEALAMLEEALRRRLEQGVPGPIHIARFCVAKVKRVLGRVDEAFAEQCRLIVTPPSGVPVWSKPDGYGNEEIGECLLAMGNEVAARRHLAIAYHVLSKDPWLSQREPARIQRLRELTGGAE
jgi:tetratricopeptide (TPR) repeat protein